MRWTRLAPGGSAIPLATTLAAARLDARSASERVRAALAERFPDHTATLHASGRDALRAGLAAAAKATGRNEVVLPAYACYSIPAAAVRAGLSVRLVDTDDRGWICPDALARTPLDRAVAVVVTNLFGVPEPVDAIAPLAQSAGALVIDDAAQAMGARARDGIVGGRGNLGLLSFGRGKPLSALGGGALLCRAGEDDTLAPTEPDVTGEGGARAALRGLAYDVARAPFVLGPLARIPALGIGTTVYDPSFDSGPMPAEAVALAAALLSGLDAANADRATRAAMMAEAIESGTPFDPLRPRDGEHAIHPRLGLLAPSGEHRDRALERLAFAGATAMYPATLDAVDGLAPNRVGDGPLPSARDFCARLLTLPTHAGMTPRRIDRVVAELARVGSDGA